MPYPRQPRITKTCLNSACLRDFESLVSSNRICCSPSCAATVRNSRRSDYQTAWPTRSKLYYESREEKKCDICSALESGWAKRFHVDHCHSTNLIRGLLCQGCNLHLGRWEKSSVQLLLYLSTAGTGIYLDLSSDWTAQCGRDRFYANTTLEKTCQSCSALSKKNRLSIDHRESDGEIRGILCIPCNSVLGWYERWTVEVNSYLGVAA